MPFLQTRALRANFRNQLLHQFSICTDVLAALFLRLALIWERSKDPLCYLPSCKFLLGPIS